MCKIKTIEKISVLFYSIALCMLSIFTVNADEYQEIELPRTSSTRRYAIEQSCKVIANVESEYSVYIERNTVLKKDENKIEFCFGVNGDIAGDEEIEFYATCDNVYDTYGNKYEIIEENANHVVMDYKDLNYRRYGYIYFDKDAKEDINVVVNYKLDFRKRGDKNE